MVFSIIFINTHRTKYVCKTYTKRNRFKYIYQWLQRQIYDNMMQIILEFESHCSKQMPESKCSFYPLNINQGLSTIFWKELRLLWKILAFIINLYWKHVSTTNSASNNTSITYLMYCKDNLLIFSTLRFKQDTTLINNTWYIITRFRGLFRANVHNIGNSDEKALVHDCWRGITQWR